MKRSDSKSTVSLISQASKDDTEKDTIEKAKASVESTKVDDKITKSKKMKSKPITKSHKKPSTPKKSKKDDTMKSASQSDSVASLVCGVLMTEVLTWKQSELPEEKFLSMSDLLDVLADLVLAVPSCASAIHTFRVRGKDKGKKALLAVQLTNALVGCPSPPKSFVNFVLHVLLPQDLWSIKNDPQIWGRQKQLNKTETSGDDKRKLAIATVKLSQASARVLLTLVARPGDIRKRVVADLAFALSGGLVSHGLGMTNDPSTNGLSNSNSQEMHALQAWGEICHAIAVPRLTGKEFEVSSSLSMGSVRLLLESGMVHALLYAIKRIRLQHEMASNTGGILLLPLEILTRPAVTDAVAAAAHLGSDDTKTAERLASADLPDTSLQVNHNLEMEDHGENEVLPVQYDQDDDMDDADAENHGSASDEQDAMSVEDSIMDDDSSESTSSDQEDNDSEEDMSEVEESIEGDGAWDAEYEEPFVVDRDQSADDAEDTSDGSDPTQIDEDWTQIDRQGNGRFTLDRGIPQGFREMAGARAMVGARGYIDAAEAMISSLMRNGDISGETLAEIEGTLGIRIVNGNRLLRGNPNAEANPQNSFRLRVLGSGGGDSSNHTAGGNLVAPNNSASVPVIHQQSQPDIFHAALSRSGQGTDVGPMECVFGGPSLTGGSTNYSLTGGARRSRETEDPQMPAQIGLFPNGPASAVRMIAQPPIHPLFASVELPPVNALVSDMVSHEERSRSRISQQRMSRRLGDWTTNAQSSSGYFPSAIGGNARNRIFPNAFPSQQRQISGLVVWPDEWQIPGNYSERLASTIQDAMDPVTEQASERISADISSENTREGATRHMESEPTVEASRDTVSEVVAGSGVEPMSLESGPLEGGASTLVAELRDSLDVSGAVGTSTAGASSNIERPSARGDAAPQDGESGQSVLDPDSNASGVEAIPAANNGDGNTDHGTHQPDAHENQTETEAQVDDSRPDDSNDASELSCPPGFDEDVFRSLPREMQEDCVNQYNATQELAQQLDGSTLDPAVLAELPEDMRREVIEQDRQQRLLQQQEQVPADPSHAQEMDNASIIASMAPELREEILMTLDESVLNTLPPQIIAEAQILRERASVRQRRLYEPMSVVQNQEIAATNTTGTGTETRPDVTSKKKTRQGRIRVDADREEIVFLPEPISSPITVSDLKALLRFLFLLAPLRPNRVLQRVLSNLSENKLLRGSLTTALIWLLHGDGRSASKAIEDYGQCYPESSWRGHVDQSFSFEASFPPSRLYGAVSDVPDSDLLNMNLSPTFMRHRQGLGTAASVAGHLRQPENFLHSSATTPPVVAARILDVLVHMSRNPKISLHFLVHKIESDKSGFGKLLDLLKANMFTICSTTLDQLLSLLELCVCPLTCVAKKDEAANGPVTTPPDIQGKEFLEVPRVEVTPEQLQVLCSTLRMESCRDSGFSKVNTIVRRLCRVEANRSRVLQELATVADGLGTDAYQDLRSLRIRMERVVAEHEHELEDAMAIDNDSTKPTQVSSSLVGSISSSVSLSTSTSEMKLLRVLQTLQALCNEGSEDRGAKKNELVTVTPDLVHLLRQLQLDVLWDELSACLKVVQVLEGIKKEDDNAEEKDSENDDDNDEGAEEKDPKHKTLRNSAAGLLARFLPSVEAFFVANACVIKPTSSSDNVDSVDSLVGGKRMLGFVSTNKVLLNVLIRSNSSLLDKGMRVLVQIPQFRPFLDFDVKRHWFKTQVKRLRRRYGSLRLQIRRDSVFQDAYFQLQPRNADEMRGRLNVTFRNEEGVDAGGLSREFFAILAKEIFNPNYALFTSTEDGCTFQPNPNSMINPDHLSYFRFVGRVVGKAVVDGYLLDSHFTRSLYKHMLGLKPTHHDMEAIDPDYYGNLRTILENDLEDMGLDHLTFSIDDFSFGRNQVIDLIPNGRSTKVTDENKEEYVRHICQHRMTTSIKSQIKSYLDGFYEMVSPELIAIFTPRELELLISGLPDIDVHDLKEHTDYVGWKAADKEIGWFWNVLFSLSRNEKAAFLQFVTGSSKVPLAGFSELQGMRGLQRFSIHKTGGSKGALMSAHTCFNSLDLPTYTSEEETREKLLLAINEGVGAFGFA